MRLPDYLDIVHSEEPGTSNLQVHGRKPDWQVTLWPNRSMSRSGRRGFLVLLAACFTLFALLTLFAPGYDVGWSAQLRVLAVVAAFMLATLALVWLAFHRNTIDGHYFERLAIVDGRFVIEAQHPRRPRKRWEFQSYWTSVKTRTTREVENQIILSYKDKAVAIGAFLSPEERAELAGEIETALAKYGRHWQQSR